MRVLLAAIALLLPACLDPDLVECGDLVCGPGKVCAPTEDRCVFREQLDGCAGAGDGAACSYPGVTDGICEAEVCTFPGCGNLILEPGEQCDDGNRIPFDGCSADCLSDERCGNGVAEPALGETCDCGEDAEHQPIACDTPNTDAPGGACRTTCTLAGCGDGVRDPGELCDDGNTVAGDGCRADCAGRWTELDSGTLVSLRAVWADAADHAWAVGDAGMVLRFDGVAWSRVASPTSSGLLAVWGAGPTDVFVGGSAGVWRWDGTIWNMTTGSNTAAIWGASATDVYSVASSVDGVIHWDGAAAGSSGFTPGCFDLWGSAANDIYGVRNATQAIHYDGTAWTDLAGPSLLGQRVWGAGANDVYALDGNTIHHYDGAAVTDYAEPGFSGSQDLGGTGPADVIVVGDGGHVLVKDAAGWRVQDTYTAATLFGVYGYAPGRAFIVGSSGTILY